MTKLPAPNGGLIHVLASLLRIRAAQITAVAALLLTLVQVGKMVTGEAGTVFRQVVRMHSGCSGARRRATQKTVT